MTATPSADTGAAADAAIVPTVFPALDTMRAVAALAVLTTHVAFWGGAYTQPYWGPALARLDIGVAVFFVLSGFLLSRPYWARARDGRPAPPTSPYLVKRALRIVPVYLVAVAVALLVLPGNDGAGAGTWAKTLLMLNIYADESLPHGLTQMWSLGTEVAFYLVLPLLMALVLARRGGPVRLGRRVAPMCAVLIGVNLAWILAVVPRLDDVPGSPGLWLPAYATWFGTGLAIAAAQVQLDGLAPSGRRSAAHALRELGRLPGTCWTAALALFALAATPIAGPYSLLPATLGEAVTKNLLYAAIAALVILPAVFADPRRPFGRALEAPALRHVGHISYGIFCLHLVVLELVADWRDVELFSGDTAELFVLTLAGTLLVSELAYRVVEQPFMRLRRFAPGLRRERPAAARA